MEHEIPDFSPSARLKAGHSLKDEYVRIKKLKEQGETPNIIEIDILARFENQDLNKLTKLERDLMDQCSAEENYEIGCLYEGINYDNGDPNFPIALLFYEKAATKERILKEAEMRDHAKL